MSADIRKDSEKIGVLSCAGIDKTVVLLGVSVEVYHETYVLESGNELAGVVDFRMQPLIRLHPLPIQIKTTKIGAKIAVYHSIGIEHGH